MRGKMADEFKNAGFKRDAVTGDMVFVVEVAEPVDFLEIESRTQLFPQEPGAILFAAAYHQAEKIVIDLKTGVTGDLLPGRFRESLGIEHQAVHVEDDAAARGQEGVVEWWPGRHG